MSNLHLHFQKEFLRQENWIFPPSGRASSVQESASDNLSLSTKKIGFFHPSGKDSSVEESTSVKLSLSTNKIGFFHLSGRASSVQESASVNLSLFFWYSVTSLYQFWPRTKFCSERLGQWYIPPRPWWRGNWKHYISMNSFFVCFLSSKYLWMFKFIFVWLQFDKCDIY